MPIADQSFPFALQPPRAALFDLDGTLVRTFIDFPAMRHAMQELSQRYGTADATSQTDDILEIVAVMASALGGESGDRARQEAYAILESMERAGCANPEQIDGASALLQELRACGSSVAIITRNCRSVAEDLTQRMNLPHDTLIAREDTQEFKPHPEPLLVALRRFDISAAEAVMVGDLWADIAAGKAAGVGATIGIQWQHDPPERFARCCPDIEVDSLTPLHTLLLPHRRL